MERERGRGQRYQAARQRRAHLGTFAVGGQPNGILFDGQNIWVTISPNTISKLRASDGKVLGTFATGSAPWWPAFDGKNVWIPNASSGTVTVLRAYDGKVIHTLQSPSAIGAAFDGENVWITTTPP